jgi:predicted dehydrogenase
MGADARDPLPVGVVGCGRMGRLHARVYSQMPQVRLVAVVDPDADAAAEVAKEFSCRALSSVADLAPLVAAASIAAPTSAHLAAAEPLLSRAVACLIEKPLAPDAATGRQIVELAKMHCAVLQVGHIERFNPALRAAQRLGIRPRFMEVTRISPLTFRSIDVGAVLDMMIHDIDIVLLLADSPVTRVDAVGVSVIGKVEDICNARLTFASGAVANLTASRLTLKTERKLRLFSPDAYVSIDFHKKAGVVARRSGNLDAIRNVVAQIRSGQITDLSQVNFAELVQIQELQIDDETEPLRAELDNFIDAAQHKAEPAVSGKQGLAAVEVAEQIVAAAGNATLA